MRSRRPSTASEGSGASSETGANGAPAAGLGTATEAGPRSRTAVIPPLPPPPNSAGGEASIASMMPKSFPRCSSGTAGEKAIERAERGSTSRTAVLSSRRRRRRRAWRCSPRSSSCASSSSPSSSGAAASDPKHPSSAGGSSSGSSSRAPALGGATLTPSGSLAHAAALANGSSITCPGENLLPASETSSPPARQPQASVERSVRPSTRTCHASPLRWSPGESAISRAEAARQTGADAPGATSPVAVAVAAASSSSSRPPPPAPPPPSGLRRASTSDIDAAWREVTQKLTEVPAAVADDASVAGDAGASEAPGRAAEPTPMPIGTACRRRAGEEEDREDDDGAAPSPTRSRKNASDTGAERAGSSRVAVACPEPPPPSLLPATNSVRAPPVAGSAVAPAGSGLGAFQTPGAAR